MDVVYVYIFFVFKWNVRKHDNANVLTRFTMLKFIEYVINDGYYLVRIIFFQPKKKEKRKKHIWTLNKKFQINLIVEIYRKMKIPFPMIAFKFTVSIQCYEFIIRIKSHH